MNQVRPLYETQEDLNRETSVIKYIEKIASCQARKLPIRYFVDYCLMRDNEIIAFVEIKVRNNKHNLYSTFMISLAKWVEGKSLSKYTNTPFFFIIKFTDCIKFFDLNFVTPTFGWGGRKDRKDSQDMEPVVFIKLADFQPIQELFQLR